MSEFISHCIQFQCCNHIATSKALVSKKKEAQKLGAWALSKVTELTKKSKTKNSSTSPPPAEDDVAALETAFGNLDAKLN